MNLIKNRNVLIICPGSSLNKYSKRIKKYIRKNNITTIGCNNISKFIIPDYHVWGDPLRYERFGYTSSEKSIMVFPSDSYHKTTVKKAYPGRCKIIKFKNAASKDFKRMKEKGMSREDFKKAIVNKTYKIKYDGEYIHGRFRAIGCLVILWCYFQKADSIDIVGMDGYSLHNEASYSEEENSRYFYNSKMDGYDSCSSNRIVGDMNHKEFYDFSYKKDGDIYKNLKDIRKLGVKFEILTPTVYKKFYNSSILSKKG